MTDQDRVELQQLVDETLDDMRKEMGTAFSLDKVNLAEMERRTGITRKRLRTIKENGFKVLPHKNAGTHRAVTVVSGFSGVIDTMLKEGKTNSQNIFDKVKEVGYKGSLTQIKVYIKDHRYLVPAPRRVVEKQGRRSPRYTTGPGESYQMDWGFVKVDTGAKIACFAMICHHCGDRYTEFFPNAKQENLFIGMIHAFQYLGIPQTVLTDNMKSVVTRRDVDGKPVWNKEYANFMVTIGFETKLCKARHPFTKGKVERLIRFIKDNLIDTVPFESITELNYQARRWCDKQNSTYHACVDCAPQQKHNAECMSAARKLVVTDEIRKYLYPERTISFDGFVNFEGRRFGVPVWYSDRRCRVGRVDYEIHIYSLDLKQELTTHQVTWSRKDSYCEDQFETEEPEEQPTTPVKTIMHQQEAVQPRGDVLLDRSFNFSKEVQW